MKPRRVFVTLEIMSDEPLPALRSAHRWSLVSKLNVLQAQANVARYTTASWPKKQRKKTRR